MRLLFEDIDTDRPSQTLHFTMHRVYLPQNASRRDLWFLLVIPGGNPWRLYAYATKTDAILAGTNWLAANEDINPWGDTSALADNPLNDPDLTGLQVEHVGSIPSKPIDVIAIWGYVAAADLVVADRIAETLSDHAVIGSALDEQGLGELPEIIVGDCGAAKPSPLIQITTSGLIPNGTIDPSRSVTAMAEIDVLVRVVVPELTTEGCAASWRLCVGMLDTVQSLLLDENRELGIPGKGIVSAEIERAAKEEDALAYSGKLKMMYQFQTLWRDDVTVGAP